ncbi:hypothetical protein GCM10010988_22010 [Cnuibacter physcomitrellae]|uniref:Uncharacterized protein n=1 Tax=Cnuibacter physcomitrellae TaxID=1619308 RepID=A0A1X9LSH3_9MICO|nr:hypothetical protein [Cnuibacter physcomitrellae]ARJ06871.1 hypothetical protein B5808_17810 [Cnuibacter physcomitrellae]GGI39026.1 hypothetical protein GCM10010988_22010 [Cnuibacter physcomitrellae]
MTIAPWPVLLTPSLEAMLRRATAAEHTATGIRRRLAFHNTRVILGALLTSGCDIHHIAQLVGVKTESVRARAERRGLLPVVSAPALTGLTGEDLATLPLHAPWGAVPGPTYRADDVVRLLQHLDSATG